MTSDERRDDDLRDPAPERDQPDDGAPGDEQALDYPGAAREAEQPADELEDKISELDAHIDEARERADTHHEHAHGDPVSAEERERRDAPLGARPDDDGTLNEAGGDDAA